MERFSFKTLHIINWKKNVYSMALQSFDSFFEVS